VAPALIVLLGLLDKDASTRARRVAPHVFGQADGLVPSTPHVMGD
jgi:hypothetical protein